MSGLRRSALLFFAVLTVGAAFVACGREAADEAAPSSSEAGLGIPGLEQVRSGELEATLRIAGPQEQNLYMRVLGTFLGVSRGSIPQIDFAAEASGEVGGKPVDISTALISTHDRAVLTYDGDTFETDPHTFERLRQSFGGAVGSGSSADLAACLEAAGQILTSQIAGGPGHPIKTTRLEESAGSIVTADLKVRGMIEALHQLERDPGCGAQLQAAGPLQSALAVVEDELEEGGSAAEARLTLDENGTLQELSVHVGLGPQGTREAEFLLRLSKVNEIAKLPPCHGEHSLAALFARLGFNPLEAIEDGEAQGVIGLLQGIYAHSAAAGRA